MVDWVMFGRHATGLHGKQFTVIGQQSQRDNAAKQRAYGHQIEHTPWHCEANEDQNVMDAKISFTDVIQLGHQFQKTEQHNQYNDYQYKATQKANANVAIKSFH